MAYVIAEPCIGRKEFACVSVCPVDCISPGPDDARAQSVEQLYVDPDVCIDCGACRLACPVEAPMRIDQLPDKWLKFVEINQNYFRDR